MKKVILFLLLYLSFYLSCFSNAQDNKNIRVLTYNVWYGFTKKPDRKKEWIKYIRSLKSDIIALQELNNYTEEDLAKDAKSWGHPHTALLKEDGFPTGITSKYPIEDLKKTTNGYHHGMLSCKIAGLQIYNIHLHPGHWEIRHREVDLLIKTLKKHKPNEPILLVGDFNTFSKHDEKYYDQTPDIIPFFRRLDQRWKSNRNLRDDQLDYTHLNKFENAGYIDLIAERRAKFMGTFPTKLRLDEDNGPARRLDYFFANKELSKRCKLAKYLINPKTDLLSDHYPAIAEFSLD